MDLIEYQSNLLIVQAVFGLGVLGFLLPLTTVIHACEKGDNMPCIPGKGRDYRVNFNRFQMIMSMISKAVKMIPLVYCLTATEEARRFFALAGSSDCSDELTNNSFSQLGEDINKVRMRDYRCLFIDVTMIVYYIGTLLFAAIKEYKDRKLLSLNRGNTGIVMRPKLDTVMTTEDREMPRVASNLAIPSDLLQVPETDSEDQDKGLCLSSLSRNSSRDQLLEQEEDYGVAHEAATKIQSIWRRKLARDSVYQRRQTLQIKRLDAVKMKYE